MSESRIKRVFSVKKAHETQLRLSKSIIFKDNLPKKVRLVAGVDVAYARGTSIGAAVVLDYDSLELVESEASAVEHSSRTFQPCFRSEKSHQPFSPSEN